MTDSKQPSRSCSISHVESMLCPVLIGRSAEMGALTDALDAAGEGRGGVVFVTGDAGVGKSRLVREAVGVAWLAGVRGLFGRARESSVPLPLSPSNPPPTGAPTGASR